MTKITFFLENKSQIITKRDETDVIWINYLFKQMFDYVKKNDNKWMVVGLYLISYGIQQIVRLNTTNEWMWNPAKKRLKRYTRNFQRKKKKYTEIGCKRDKQNKIHTHHLSA